MYNPISLGNWRPVVIRQPPGVVDVALTFDDGPALETTPRVLEMLERARARATFFLSGVRVASYPGLVREIVGAGHAVYGHAWDHTNLELTSSYYALRTIRQVEEILARFRPTPNPYLIRLPYNAGHNRSRMHRVVNKFHPDTRFALFTFSTYDYLLGKDCESLTTLEKRCIRTAQVLCSHPSLPGSILLLHEMPFDIPPKLSPVVTEILLPALLSGITARGLPLGLIQTHSAHRMLNRFLLLDVIRDRFISPAPPASYD